MDDAGWRGCDEFVLCFELVPWPDCERRRLATHSLGRGLGSGSTGCCLGEAYGGV